jgi:glucose-6-phosphate-specific signal transduction histidine kinase
MPAQPGSATSVRGELTVVVLITALASFIAIKFDLSEALFSWTRTREWLQLDELPGVLLVFTACLVWFSARRFFDARYQIIRRRELDVQLAGALSENRRLAQQYVLVQESERRALARDLHDELGQYLNAIKIDAIALRERLKADPVARATAAQMLGNIDLVQGTVIGLIRQLRPAGLDEFGLAGALEQCVAEWRRRLPHTEVDLSLDADLGDLDEIHRLTVYRLVQEALTNVARHSQASRVEITVGRQASSPPTVRSIVARIADNGRGLKSGDPPAGLGLIGMRERVEALGGTLELSCPPQAGFVVLARIPAETPK